MLITFTAQKTPKVEGQVDQIRHWMVNTGSNLNTSFETFKLSFSSFRDNFSTGMNFLRRRFSSSDLQGDLRDSPDPAAFLPRKGPSPSAPSSPSKGSVQGITRGLFTTQKPAYNKERCKTLLVVDDHHTDW